MTKSSNSPTPCQPVVSLPAELQEDSVSQIESMKHPPPMDYLRLDDHYPTTSTTPAQDYWLNSTSSLMSLDEFLEQVSYQENLATESKTSTEPIVKVDFR